MNIPQVLQKVTQLYQGEKFAEAEDVCCQILKSDPAVHGALYMLGAILLRRGEVDGAVDLLRRAVTLAPAIPVYQSAYGTALFSQQKFTEAADAYRRAMHDSPRLASAHRGLGRALTQLWELELAIQSLKKALELGAPRAETLADIATAQRRLGKWHEGLESAREAVTLQPQFAWGHNILGLIQGDLGDFPGAKASFERAIALRPDQPEAYSNLAKNFRSTGHFSTAVETLRNVTNLSPRYVVGHANLGMALTDVGEVDEAIAAYRHALELYQDAPATRSNMLLCMNYSPKLSRQLVADEHRRWGVMHGLGSSPQPPAMRHIEPGKPLRVGYVSADLCRHPVASFFEPILQNHNPNVVEAYVYNDTQRPDEITARMKHLTPRWTDWAGRSNALLEKVIRSEQIDILVDLNGHTELNRLQVFARKPAPVQVSYLGYPNTTGLMAMDYWLTDAWADPPGSEQWYTEKLVRLPRCFLCYKPPADAPLPEHRVQQSSITFGSFNKLAKITDDVIALWARILAETANSRLTLKDSATADPSVCDAVRARLQKGGIDPHRVTLEAPRQRQIDHLSLYNSIDIALDTFPYNGTTTTCEALWMGVPVITLAGEPHASRVSLSILHTIGYAEWVAHSPDEYVRLAVKLAADTSRRTQLRQGLRQNMAQSSLMDAKGFVTALEAAYQQMWRERCLA